MVESVQGALGQLQVDEKVLAVGQFQPRGHTGSMFAGGLIGSSVGGSGLADSIATVGGSIAGYKLHDAASGLPGLDARRRDGHQRVRLRRRPPEQ